MKYLRIRTTVSVIQTDPAENVEIPMKLEAGQWPDVKLSGDWTPTDESVMINIERVKERTLGAKRNPCYCGKEIEKPRFIKTMCGNL